MKNKFNLVNILTLQKERYYMFAICIYLENVIITVCSFLRRYFSLAKVRLSPWKQEGGGVPSDPFLAPAFGPCARPPITFYSRSGSSPICLRRNLTKPKLMRSSGFSEDISCKILFVHKWVFSFILLGTNAAMLIVNSSNTRLALRIYKENWRLKYLRFHFVT